MPINFVSVYNQNMRLTFDNGYTISIAMNVDKSVIDEWKAPNPETERDMYLMPNDSPSVTYSDTANAYITHEEDDSIYVEWFNLSPNQVADLIGRVSSWPGSIGYEKFETQSNINQ